MYFNKKGLLLVVWFVGMVWLAKGPLPIKAESLPPISPVLEPVLWQQEGGNGQDSDCLMCHANHNFTGVFADGEQFSLYVDDSLYAESVHGPAGLECVACHTDISEYPHHVEQVTCLTCHETEEGDGVIGGEYVSLEVELPFNDRREMTITINDACRSCHEEEFDMALDSAHVKAQLSGNREAPLCVDCHGSHDITAPDTPRAKISHTCAECHKAVFSTYRSSIHGAALEIESNPDVPTCVDCHGVHSVRGPRNATFHNESIALCGSCHSDKELMEKYDISTDVFDTYLDDFHGRTVNLFRRQNGGIASNKAVCFDCHGIHNIRAPDDPLSTVYPDNLQHTCQQCHQEATIRFPQAWLSHFVPTWEQTPFLYMVNSVYKILIPLTMGGFVAYIGLDASKRWRDKREIIRQAMAEAKEEYDDFDFE